MSEKVLFSLLFPILFFLFLFPCFGASDSIPVGMLVSQLTNLSLLAALVFFSQRKRIRQVFKDKRTRFLKSVEESKQSKRQAWSVLREVTDRFNEMEKNFDEKITEARKNAENSYQNQVREAKAQALSLKKMAEGNFEFEIQKQVENLKKESFQKSARLAEKEIKENFGVEKLRAWNVHFTSTRGVK